MITMFDEPAARSRSHGLRPEVLDAQADRLGLRRVTGRCGWDTYDAAFGDALRQVKADGVTHVIFGDILFDEHRLWAETQCAAHGLTAVLHPHVGTMVENRAEVDQVLAGSTIPLCLDTGHLLIGGTDPLELTRQVPHRIAHTHLKDVDAALAARVRSGELTYTEAVAAGMYVPLGAGDVDIAGIITTLQDNGFDGWYVMEQDTILAGEPAGAGPLADVRASVAFLQGVPA